MEVWPSTTAGKIQMSSRYHAEQQFSFHCIRQPGSPPLSRSVNMIPKGWGRPSVSGRGNARRQQHAPRPKPHPLSHQHDGTLRGDSMCKSTPRDDSPSPHPSPPSLHSQFNPDLLSSRILKAGLVHQHAFSWPILACFAKASWLAFPSSSDRSGSVNLTDRATEISLPPSNLSKRRLSSIA
ncbi:hypothetical protein VTI74DRAFT_1042 [Chaetomium olivicolor]